MKDQIEKIFQIRDRAVANRDKVLFLSTQIDEIPMSGSDGYLKMDKLISAILYVHNDDKNPNLWITLVKEEYFFDGNFSHQNYLIYKLENRKNKLLISDIKW